ncbi:MAG: hypothetical protein U5N85_19385 [Arcicella sp.]|nr:hypothetical protein [Arcicella sp.]
MNDEDPLFKNANDYFKYFIQNKIAMKISTISIAEYCTRGSIADLPLRNLEIVPFNLNHAKRTGEFANIVFQKKGTIKFDNRNIIPNDTKLFAQADCDKTVDYYLSSDSESFKVYKLLQRESNPQFQFTDLKVPYNEMFGILPL